MTGSRTSPIFYGVDRIAVLLYAAIVAAGFLFITAASYEEGGRGSSSRSRTST